MRMKPGRFWGGGGFANADRDRRARAGLVLHETPCQISSAAAQVVQVGRGDRAEPLKARVAKDIALTAQDAGGRRSRQGLQRAVDLGQQRHIRARIAPCKGMGGRSVALHQRLTPHPARDQSGHLCAAVPERVNEIGTPGVMRLESTRV